LTYIKALNYKTFVWHYIMFFIVPCGILLELGLLLVELFTPFKSLSTFKILVTIFSTGCLIPILIYATLIVEYRTNIVSAYSHVLQIERSIKTGKRVMLWILLRRASLKILRFHFRYYWHIGKSAIIVALLLAELFMRKTSVEKPSSRNALTRAVAPVTFYY